MMSLKLYHKTRCCQDLEEESRSLTDHLATRTEEAGQLRQENDKLLEELKLSRQEVRTLTLTVHLY